MVIHDWSRIDAGTYHAFHTAWVTHLSEMLNDGRLPSGYYALPEQHAGRPIADVLTLHAGSRVPPPEGAGGLAVAEAPPSVSRRLTTSGTAAARRRTLAVRHVSGHQIIALVEIASPANKDRARHVDDLVSKIVSALGLGIHILLIDLFVPGPHDPGGIHGAVWEQLEPEHGPWETPPTQPLALASYVAGPEVEVYLENRSIGEALPDMPLFLQADRYINAPLKASYQAAFKGLPSFWREILQCGIE